MPRRPGKRKRARMHQQIQPPPPGSEVIGYVRYSSEMYDLASLLTQKRGIEKEAHKFQWPVQSFYQVPAPG